MYINFDLADHLLFEAIQQVIIFNEPVDHHEIKRYITTVIYIECTNDPEGIGWNGFESLRKSRIPSRLWQLRWGLHAKKDEPLPDFNTSNFIKAYERLKTAGVIASERGHPEDKRKSVYTIDLEKADQYFANKPRPEMDCRFKSQQIKPITQKGKS